MSMCKAIFVGELTKELGSNNGYTRFEITTKRTDYKTNKEYVDTNYILLNEDILSKFTKPYVGKFGYFEGTLTEINKMHYILAAVGFEMMPTQVKAAQEAMPFHV